MPNKPTSNLRTARITTAAVIAGVLISLIVFINGSWAQVWTEPTQNPPNGNASAPIWNQATTAAAQNPGDFHIVGSGRVDGRFGINTDITGAPCSPGGRLCITQTTANSTNYGVYTSVSGGTANNYGVYSTVSGANSYGIYASGSTYAGYFSGAANVTGNMTVGGTFNSVGAITQNGTAVCLSTGSGCPSGGGTTTGSGTTNYVAKWTGASSLGNSLIRDDGSGVGIGTAPFSSTALYISGSYPNAAISTINTNAGGFALIGSAQGALAGVYGNATGSSNGVYGTSSSGWGGYFLGGSGVYGSGSNYGVYGTSTNEAINGVGGLVGVRGSGTNNGVIGTVTTSGTGVLGSSTGGGYGLYGTGATGVYGNGSSYGVRAWGGSYSFYGDSGTLYNAGAISSGGAISTSSSISSAGIESTGLIHTSNEIRVDEPGYSQTHFNYLGGATNYIRGASTNINSANNYITGNLYLYLPVSGGASQAVCFGAWSGGGNLIDACVSSLKYKKDVADLTLGLDEVMQLRPVSFNWKLGGTHDLGFIAEEVEKVNPLLAGYDKDGNLINVKYSQMSALLVNAMQEQQQQIEALSARLAELEKKIK